MKIAIKLLDKPEPEIIDGVVMVEEDFIDLLYHIGLFDARVFVITFFKIMLAFLFIKHYNNIRFTNTGAT